MWSDPRNGFENEADPGMVQGTAPGSGRASLHSAKPNDMQRLSVLKGEAHLWGHRVQRTRQGAETLPSLLHTGKSVPPQCRYSWVIGECMSFCFTVQSGTTGVRCSIF